jgi:release factor glutamine methyltransferase
VVSNPPYIAEADAHLSEGDLPAEPRTALVGGATGLEALQEIICLTPNALSPGGWLLLEHGYDQAESVAGMLRDAGFSDVRTRSDWSGQPRITGGQWAI